MPNCVICVVSRALSGGWGVVVAWSRKCCLGPSETASFVSRVLFKDGGRVQDFIFPLTLALWANIQIMLRLIK